MHIITLLNEKGGVGKTTLSVHIAAGLAIRGQRVLLIDADAQANATMQLGVQPYGGIYRLLIQDETWQDTVRIPPPEIWAGDHPTDGELWVLPSNIETRLIPMATDDLNILRERLEDLEGYVDTVVIDTSPTPSMLHTMMYQATSSILFPSECEALSLNGLANTTIRTGNYSQQRKQAGLPGIQILGVQPTMYDARTNAHDYGLNQIQEHFGKEGTWSPIATRTAWRDAGYANKTLFAYTPDHPAALEAWGMVDRTQEAITING